ncbi:hypothetical protein CHH59_12605 [Shouchella clausii]|uniref:single-stranded DNA-binding protein n=1 Tax=Shouchella clausii TaxID=79880 RepID=UPI000BA71657|nr:single-stranded DNA-binding protein [Shouchella clausii]PAF13683.1 hypothetical protein CHH59_12605 [Shouchella clausii]
MNQVVLKGRVVADLEMRFTPGGKGVVSGTLAVQRRFKNQDGNYDADFIDFVQWGEKPAEILSKYVSKGDELTIAGEMRTRIYENNEGRKVKVTECHVEKFDLPSKPKSQGNQNDNSQSDSGYDDPFGGGAINISSDDLPF